MFDLHDSPGYCITLCDLGCKQAKDAGELIINNARPLIKFKYMPEIGSQLAAAERKLEKANDILAEARLAVKMARTEYEKHTKPHLVEPSYANG